MSKYMTFEQWKATVVFVSDLRPFEREFCDGHSFYLSNESVSGAIFFTNTPSGDFNPLDEAMSPPRYHPAGVLWQYKGMWTTICYNEEPQFASFDAAAWWLWENYAGIEYGVPAPKYRFIVYDRSGIPTRVVYRIDMPEIIRRSKAILDSTANEYGSLEVDMNSDDSLCYHEFQYGHMIAVKIEDEE